MIFDSAPGERRYLGLYRAISEIFGKKRRFNSIISMFISISLIVIWFVEDAIVWFRNLFFNGEPIQSNPCTALKDENSYWPQMFLYSKDDLLIPHYVSQL